MTNQVYPILLMILISIATVKCSSENLEYRITSGGLKIEATAHGRFVPKDSLIIESISIVDFNHDIGYEPSRRLWGIGQPAINAQGLKLEQYLEGWFLLDNGNIALAFLSEHKSAIAIETNLTPPPQVELLSNIDSSLPIENRKTVILLGTSSPIKLKKKMEEYWANGQVE